LTALSTRSDHRPYDRGVVLQTAVTMGGNEGNFELNAFRPILIDNYLHSALIMADMCDHFREFMVEGTKLNQAGLTFVLSGGAAILARYGGRALQPWQTVLVLSLVSALWLVVAVYFLGDISAHFNPATTLAFALRRDMGWIMAGAYWVVQFAAAVCGSLLARAFFGPAGNLAATMPKPGQSWQAAGFEAIITFGLVLMVLNLRPAGRGGLHHGLGHHGRTLRRRLHEPGPQLRTGCGHRRPVHLVGLPGRAGDRRGHRGGSRAGAARAGQGPGS
jgi:hypothetical protein